MTRSHIRIHICSRIFQIDVMRNVLERNLKDSHSSASGHMHPPSEHMHQYFSRSGTVCVAVGFIQWRTHDENLWGAKKTTYESWFSSSSSPLTAGDKSYRCDE
jgi:hypothetical protein